MFTFPVLHNPQGVVLHIAGVLAVTVVVVQLVVLMFGRSR